MPDTTHTYSMDELVSLCKRRGFIYPASEIYGGINGFWDYGPLGTTLKNNLRDRWWRDMVKRPPLGPDGNEISIVGLDSSIIQNPRVWEASGHVGSFSDPMQTCRQCKKLFRADQVWEMVKDSDWLQSLAEACTRPSVDNAVKFNSDQAMNWARKRGRKLAPGLALVRNPEVTISWLVEELEDKWEEYLDIISLIQHLATEQKAKTGLITPCPNCGGDLTEPREFNLMFESSTGAIKSDDSKVYLRPETAQGIFLNFGNVVDTMRVKVPFGIAQVGKAFRNEVTPRNFIFRSREFEQMELEWFCHEDEAEQWFEFWCDVRSKWWQTIGLTSENILMRKHDSDELAHYAKDGCGTFDIEYRFPFTFPGFGELEGVAHRGNYDLTRHQEFSKKKLSYFDQAKNERYIPHVIEPSAGLSRGTLALLCEAYTPDPERASKVYMAFHPSIAPIQA
ncbi:MAG: glycine--tRNA ligase, partial [Phycisphaerales bacterium]|nr:glycine--tRNA ligase [Phycisphaerales bacterium]